MTDKPVHCDNTAPLTVDCYFVIRYKNINMRAVKPIQVRRLYDTTEEINMDELEPVDIPAKRPKRCDIMVSNSLLTADGRVTVYRRLTRHRVPPPDTSSCTAAWHVIMYRRLTRHHVPPPSTSSCNAA